MNDQLLDGLWDVQRVPGSAAMGHLWHGSPSQPRDCENWGILSPLLRV